MVLFIYMELSYHTACASTSYHGHNIFYFLIFILLLCAWHTTGAHVLHYNSNGGYDFNVGTYFMYRHSTSWITLQHIYMDTYINMCSFFTYHNTSCDTNWVVHQKVEVVPLDFYGWMICLSLSASSIQYYHNVLTCCHNHARICL